MLAIEMLRAGHGDALVVEYGTSSDVHRILVDAGPLRTWDDEVAPRLKQMPDHAYEVFVVTHIDEDHIGGAAPLLSDTNLRHRVRDVWFNGFVHCTKGGNILGPVDGERLTKLIVKGGFTWNAPFRGKVSRGVGGPVVVSSQGELPHFELPGGAVVHLLSPSGTMLTEIAERWEEVVLEAGLVPGAGTDKPARKPPIKQKLVAPPADPLTADELKLLATRDCQTDQSAANGASIAFILEFGGKRALLGADAHPDILAAGLRRFAKQADEQRTRIHLCKLPHHGSKFNVTTELIESMDVAKYLVSSNGDNYAHPDDDTIARIVLASSRPPTFYCNYASARTRYWAERAATVGAKVVLPKERARSLRVPA
jgi:beta-lactamase superfamily II metal-dependent hydrolase